MTDTVVNELVALLTLERLEDNLFRGAMTNTYIIDKPLYAGSAEGPVRITFTTLNPVRNLSA